MPDNLSDHVGHGRGGRDVWNGKHGRKWHSKGLKCGRGGRTLKGMKGEGSCSVKKKKKKQEEQQQHTAASWEAATGVLPEYGCSCNTHLCPDFLGWVSSGGNRPEVWHRSKKPTFRPTRLSFTIPFAQPDWRQQTSPIFNYRICQSCNSKGAFEEDVAKSNNPSHFHFFFLSLRVSLFAVCSGAKNSWPPAVPWSQGFTRAGYSCLVTQQANPNDEAGRMAYWISVESRGSSRKQLGTRECGAYCYLSRQTC